MQKEPVDVEALLAKNYNKPYKIVVSTFTLLGCVAVLFVVGCTANSSATKFNSPRAEMERAAVSETVESLQKQPVSFELAYPQAVTGEERARLFFKQYLGGLSEEEIYLSPKEDARSLRAQNEKINPIRYEVTISQGQRGLKFAIVTSKVGDFTDKKLSVIPKQLFAQNLARFIREGQLELSFLDSK